MKIFRWVLLTLAVSVSGQALAEKIAVVGIQQALLASNQAGEFRKQLKAELAADQTQVIDLEKQAKDAQAKLQSQANLVSAEEAQQLRLQFQKVFAEYQRRGQELQQKRMQREQAFLAEMKPKLDKVMKALIEQEGYDLIVSKEATLFARKELDITAKVAELLNQQ